MTLEAGPIASYAVHARGGSPENSDPLRLQRMELRRNHRARKRNRMPAFAQLRAWFIYDAIHDAPLSPSVTCATLAPASACRFSCGDVWTLAAMDRRAAK
jgi:hypothetical protein